MPLFYTGKQQGGDMEEKCAKAAAGVFVAAVMALIIFCISSQFFDPDTIREAAEGGIALTSASFLALLLFG